MLLGAVGRGSEDEVREYREYMMDCFWLQWVEEVKRRLGNIADEQPNQRDCGGVY